MPWQHQALRHCLLLLYIWSAFSCRDDNYRNDAKKAHLNNDEAQNIPEVFTVGH